MRGRCPLPSHPSQQEEPGSAPNSVQPVIDTEPAGADQPATESVLQDNNGRASDQQETSGRTSANDLLGEDKKDRKQRRMHRRILFYTVLLIVIGSIGALSVLIYIVALRNEGAKVSDGVLIAFISASAIQAFALLSIFARSLFPALPILPSKREAKEEE